MEELRLQIAHGKLQLLGWDIDSCLRRNDGKENAGMTGRKMWE
ncbi:MAG: hypothetical protein SNJ64_05125 [Endomicrobiia bacterium]